MTRKLSSLFLSFFCCVALFPQTPQPPKVALVLSGGGAKGFAHLGVLKVLEEENIPIDIIVGTSIGSIVGGLYAIGYSADEIIQISEEANWTHLLSDFVSRRELTQASKTEQQRYVISLPIAENKFPVLPRGMVNGQNVFNLFCGLAANIPQDADFTTFPISFASVGIDLETGHEVVMKNGFLPSAIYASMAIPGVFVPGHHNGHLLSDGGLVNNFPTNVAKEMGADIIIGVDLRKDLYQADEIVSMDKLSHQIINFYSLNRDSLNRELCDIIIRPDMNGYDIHSFNRQAQDTLMMRGRASTLEVLDQIRALKEQYHLRKPEVAVRLTTPDKWNIVGIKFSGNHAVSDNLLMSMVNKKIPGVYSYEKIKESINYMYGMGVFKRVYFTLDDPEVTDDGYNLENQGHLNPREAQDGKDMLHQDAHEPPDKILNIVIEEDKAWNFNVGLRLNTKSELSMILNSTRKDYSKFIGLLSFTADISKNPYLTVLAELDKAKLPKIAIQADGAYNQTPIFLSKNDYFDADLLTASIKLFTYQPFLNHSTIGLGIKQEFYDVDIHNKNGILNSHYVDENKHFFFHLYGFYQFDNLNDFYFPTRGSDVFTEFSLTKDVVLNRINPIWLLKNRNAIPLHKNSTLLLNAYARTLFSDVPIHLGNFVASKDYELRFNHHLPFYGLPSSWSTAKNTFIGAIEFRQHLYKRHYVTAAANILFHGEEFNDINTYKAIYGAGLTYEFRSPFGPMGFTLGYADAYRKLVVSANLGFWF